MGNTDSTLYPGSESQAFGLNVLASGLSEVLGVEVIIADGTQREDYRMKALPLLTMDDVFNVTYSQITQKELKSEDTFPICVKTLTGSTIFLEVADHYSIATVKADIEIREGIPSNKMRLTFRGKTLEDEKQVKSAGLSHGSTIFVMLNLHESGKPKVVLPKEDLAEEFNYDFTRLQDDGTKYFRGGYEYHRPYGCGSPFNLDVLASGFSAVLGFEVVIADSTQRRQAGMDALPTLTIDEVFKMTYPSVSEDKGNVRDGFPIFVKTLTGSTIILQVASYFTIASVKAEIEHQESIPANKQRLSFNGKKLDDDETVENAGISNGSIIFLALTLRGSGKPVVVLPKEDLAPEFNYDLSRKKDNGEKYYRGDFEYHRPYGWYRYAIKVRDAQKYGRDNTWLGPKGERTQSADGEWPVSYHGTHKKAARGIIKEGFRIGRRELHGRGVYSTPILETATKFATEFRKGLHRYKIVFQNRVNPASEHLIIIPPEQTQYNTEYWISPKQDPANNVYDIRPYGVLLRQID